MSKSVKTLSDIKFPPTGGTREFLVTCGGQPFGSFDTRDQADKARTSWSASPIPNKKSYASLQTWEIVMNPQFKS